MMTRLLSYEIPFWNAVVLIVATAIAGWTAVSIVGAIVGARTRQAEARLELERDYLRHVLTKLDEINAAIASRHDEYSAR